jgi:hypothetical protein
MREVRKEALHALAARAPCWFAHLAAPQVQAARIEMPTRPTVIGAV